MMLSIEDHLRGRPEPVVEMFGQILSAHRIAGMWTLRSSLAG
jgi:hypothetical protein